jgi:hypothetical protein
MLFIIAVDTALAYRAGNSGSIPTYTFRFGGYYFSLIFPNFVLILSFFVLSHLRRQGAQLVSQSEKLKIHQHFATVKVGIAWNSSDLSDRLVGFKTVLIANTKKTKCAKL